ncbi:MAG: hypothetical protein FMNOHCHN_00345 [Ignavibacteriaceae bacterium]|nr:hypothetical protein [Ignavibacteriaceae bacterium]
MVVYFISHFDFIPTYGGLNTLIAALSLILNSVLNRNKKFDHHSSSLLVIFLVSILFIMNVSGWILKNPSEPLYVVVNVMSFLGYITVFIVAAKVGFTSVRIANFLKITTILAVYNVLVSLVTKFGLFETQFTPVLPTFQFQFGDNIMMGTFYHSEIYGEYGMVVFLMLLPFIGNKKRENISNATISVGLIASAINCLLSFSRSAIVLLVLGAIVYFVFYYLKVKSSRSYLRYGPILVFGLLVISLLWVPLRLGFIVERFIYEDLAAPISFEGEKNLITGEGTPRELAFSYFLNRLPQEDWQIGYGWGVPNSNKIAWFGDPNTKRADFHSLYLSLPMLYGWSGSIAFILLIIVLIIKLLRRMRSINMFLNYKELIIPSLLLMFVFLMINEYKISLLRISTYHMMFWIWLGLGYATLINSDSKN